MDREQLNQESLPLHLQRACDTYNDDIIKQTEPNGRVSYAFSQDATGESS